jgi:hypothetical protein
MPPKYSGWSWCQPPKTASNWISLRDILRFYINKWQNLGVDKSSRNGLGMFKYGWKPSQPIGDHRLWPCHLQVVRNFASHSFVIIYIYIYTCYIYILFFTVFYSHPVDPSTKGKLVGNSGAGATRALVTAMVRGVFGCEPEARRGRWAPLFWLFDVNFGVTVLLFVYPFIHPSIYLSMYVCM